MVTQLKTPPTPGLKHSTKSAINVKEPTSKRQLPSTSYKEQEFIAESSSSSYLVYHVVTHIISHVVLSVPAECLEFCSRGYFLNKYSGAIRDTFLTGLRQSLLLTRSIARLRIFGSVPAPTL